MECAQIVNTLICKHRNKTYAKQNCKITLKLLLVINKASSGFKQVNNNFEEINY